MPGILPLPKQQPEHIQLGSIMFQEGQTDERAQRESLQGCGVNKLNEPPG